MYVLLTTVTTQKREEEKNKNVSLFSESSHIRVWRFSYHYNRMMKVDADLIMIMKHNGV